MAFVDNFQDFIQKHADAAGMTREEFMAVLMSEDAKKPGPDPYHRGLDDEEVEDKEDQIKKQAKMDDDDPDAYKEMPGDKEAREKGEVKKSEHTRAYDRLYKEALDEGAMGDIHQMAGEVKSEEEFIKRFFKEFGAKIKRSKDSEEFAKSLYADMNESVVNEKIKLIMRNILSKMVPAAFGPSTSPKMRQEIKDAVEAAIEPILKKYDYIVEAEDQGGSEASDQMAYAQLERIIDYATMIRQRMDAGKGLDAWMYGKVVKAEDYLNTLYDVIDGDDGVVETQKMTNKDWKKIKPFNKHTTKDGQKFVMSYDDRIGTFLEPVEIVDEARLEEAKIKYQKGKTYQTGEGWTVFKSGDDFAFDIKVNSSAAWSTDPHDDRRETLRLMDAGKQRATLRFKSGNIDKFAQQMHDLNDETTWGEKQGLTAKDYADIIRVWIDMRMANESVVNEEKAEGDRGPIDDDAIETALKKKSDETGVPIEFLRLVMRRGMAAWKSGHRPGANQQQWGYARVNSFLTKQEGTWGNADADIAKEVRDGGHDKKLKKA